jgi:hypothetical protein
MKNLILIAGAILLVFTFNSCDDNNCIVGQGSQQEYDLNLSGFDAIRVEGAVNIQLTQGPVYETLLIVEPNIFEVVETGVNGGTLFLGLDNDVCIKSAGPMTLKVTAPDFTGITISGSSSIISMNDLDLDELVISCSGAVVSDLSGTCTTQSINISGAGEFDHFDLISDDVNILVSGSGDFNIYAENNLDIRVSGSALINYKGTPSITQNVSGSLDLNDVN